jgi:uncharacterized repeat protein (TIGR02543 family)
VAVTNLNTFKPTISWTYRDENGDSQTMYEVEVWTGSGGSGTNLWDPMQMMGTSTSIFYAGSKLALGQTYYSRVRAFDGKDWSQWSEKAFEISIQYTLTMYVIGQGTVAPGNGTYSLGTNVNIKVFNVAGWTFQGWTGDANGAANITITMNGNKVVTATFVPDLPPPPNVATNFCWSGYGAVAHWMIPITFNGQSTTIPITAIFIDDSSGRTDLYISADHPSGVGKVVANLVDISGFSMSVGSPAYVRALVNFNFGTGATETHLIEIAWNYLYLQTINEPNTAFISVANDLAVSFSQGSWNPCIAYLCIDGGSIIHPGTDLSDGAIDGLGSWDMTV